MISLQHLLQISVLVIIGCGLLIDRMSDGITKLICTLLLSFFCFMMAVFAVLISVRTPISP